MTLSKTSVQSIDLDDLERQLREVAVSSLPKRSDDPLAELARIVGRDKSLRSIPGGRADAPQPAPYRAGGHEGTVTEVRPGAPHADQAEFDLEASVEEALRPGHLQNAAEDEAELLYDEDEPAPEGGSLQHSEDWEEEPYEDGATYADEGVASRFDAVEQVPKMPDVAVARDAPTGRGLMSPRALALAVPLMLAMIGVGAAVVMRVGPMSRSGGDAPVIKADEAPVKVQPAKVGSGDQTPSQTALGAADPSGKPSEIVVARPEQPVDVVAAAKAAQPRSAAPGQPPASSGVVIVSAPSGAAGAPAPAPEGAAAAPGVAAASPAIVPAALPMPTAAANVPLPALPQPSGQGSVFGTPHRVSTVTVKPDGTIVSKPRADASPPAKPTALASADTTATTAPVSTGSITPPSKKPADTVRARPSPAVTADDQQAAKAAKLAPKPAKPKVADAVQADHTADRASDAGAPLSITPQGRRGGTIVASAAPTPNASPRAPAAEVTPNVTGGSSFSIQLASSPSESDARATLSRLQRQFPSALGGGSVRRADLGGKGIFYRVRVGPLSRDAADKICSQLKAGGAECILTRG